MPGSLDPTPISARFSPPHASMLQPAIRRAGIMVCAAAAIGVLATCDASSLVSPPGTEAITLEYLGDTVASLESVLTPEVGVSIGSRPLEDPRLSFSSSDPSVVEVLPDGRLYMRKLGTATLIVSIRSSLLPANPPTLTKQFQVVAESLSISATAVTLPAVGATAV